jgi:peptide/nickel transport system substrate-binding protein
MVLAVLGGAAAAAGVSRATVQSPLQVWIDGYDTLDPALASSPESQDLISATCAGLVGFKDSAGADSKTLFADAATAMPTVSSDGKTYTFTLRANMFFSPPDQAEAVSGNAFVRAFQRAARVSDPNLGESYLLASGVLDEIAGFDAYAAGSASSISGLAVSGRSLTITLTQADPTFLSRLALPGLCAVPKTTPLKLQAMVPSAGPYYIANVTSTGLQLLANPGYGGVRPHGAAEIDVQVGTNVDTTAAVENGSLDAAVFAYVANSVWKPILSQYGPSHSPQEAFQWSGPQTIGLSFDTANPAMTQTVRKAIATALNRVTLAQLDSGAPNSNLLSPLEPGYSGPSIYTLAGNVSAAQSLMSSAGYGPNNHLSLVELGTSRAFTTTFFNALKTQLAKIYIDLSLQTVSPGAYYSTLASTTTWGLARTGWSPDFLDAWDNLGPSFAGLAPDPSDVSHYASATFTSQLATANATVGASARASALGSLADSLATGDVPATSIETNYNLAFVSARTKCVAGYWAGGVNFVLLQYAGLACPSAGRETN